MSVFRELPQLAKHVIMRILFINQPIARQLIDTWVKEEKRELLDEAVTVITGLRIWEGTGLLCNHVFAKQIYLFFKLKVSLARDLF